MKTKHFMVASLLVISFGCKKKYQEGYNAGYDVGHDEGYAETYDSGYADGNAEGLATGFDSGYADGFENGHATGFGNARVDFASAEYEQGFSEAEVVGYDEGYTVGFGTGTTAGTNEGYADGYDVSYNTAYNFHYNQNYNIGYDEGYDNEYDNGYDDGSDDGYDDGYYTGYDNGYDDQYDENWDYGYDDGYDDNWGDGYDDGYSDGYGSSTASKNPYVKLISMVNADLVDFSKVRKFDAQSVTESMGSSAGSGTVDMGKLAALKENHYLGQISNQLQSKFGLSNKSARQVSLVVHQYNKLAGSRSLTEADAKTFSQNLIGFDIGTVEGAFKDSLKGDSTKLNGMLEQASSKLGTSPENFNRMISTIFF